MENAYFTVPVPANEPVRSYLPGSSERKELKAELNRQSEQVLNIPLIIGGKEYYTEKTNTVVMPHDHGHILAKCAVAEEEHFQLAIKAALEAHSIWESLSWEHRASIFLKAAELISGPYRYKMNAATMLGQSKTVYQAEIDSACELIDFLRFNAYYAAQIFSQQPGNAKGVWNRLIYRALEGFVAVVTPFNFTAIGGNLGAAPALLGNTVIWKPATTAVLSNYYFMQILMEAGLPAGVINFLPCRGKDFSSHVLNHPKMAGIHFTGSTEVFQTMWQQVGGNISNYTSYPRLVGETGGKDFIFAHPTADVDSLVAGMVRGAFEYQGQKCSAASRAFIPESLWPLVRPKLMLEIESLKVGDVREFTNFMGAVIDKSSFDNIAGFIQRARKSAEAEVLCGGCDDTKGYFVQPTVIQAQTPYTETMVKEIFGPVLTVYVYPDQELAQSLRACDEASPYALTGAIYANDRLAIAEMSAALRHTAGNLYINDKPTGAVVGQQPFGGGRASGTNDKAGSALNLYRWLSVQTVKETLAPAKDIAYPYMSEA